MSIIEPMRDIHYKEARGGRTTLADVLQNLKEELAAQRARLADAMQAVQHLQVAIAAIERKEAEAKKRIEQCGHLGKRGYLTKVVIEALQKGIGAVSSIVRYAEEQGIKTTGPSVSNAIQHLQEKKIVQYDLKKQIWTLTEAASQSQANTA